MYLDDLSDDLSDDDAVTQPGPATPQPQSKKRKCAPETGDYDYDIAVRGGGIFDGVQEKCGPHENKTESGECIRVVAMELGGHSSLFEFWQSIIVESEEE